MVSDLSLWMHVFGVASLGWLIMWLSPTLSKITIALWSRNKIMQMQFAQKRLLKEWGDAVKPVERKAGDDDDDYI
jgi:signal transduction histidine kinase